MYDTHRYPTHIFTNYLGISSIMISHASSFVYLFGAYGSLIDGDTYTIEIETNFETLYQLIDIAYGTTAAGRDEVIAAISHALTHPKEDQECINVEEIGGLWFSHHLFAFHVVYDEDEDVNTVNPRELSYILHGYMEFDTVFPYWIDLDWNFRDSEQQALYYGRLLALQYRLYLYFSQKASKSMALAMCNLTDPLDFALAKAHYELEPGGWPSDAKLDRCEPE